MLTSITGTSSQLLFTYHILRKYPIDPFLLAVNLIQPFLEFGSDHLFNKGQSLPCPFWVACNVPQQITLHTATISIINGCLRWLNWLMTRTTRRMSRVMACKISLRMVTISHTLNKLIVLNRLFPGLEFKRSRDEIGDICTDDYTHTYPDNAPLLLSIVKQSMSRLPNVWEYHVWHISEWFDQLPSQCYFAIRLIFYPKSLTPSTYAQLQNAGGAIYQSIYSLAYERQASFQDWLDIRDIYKEEAEEEARQEKEKQLAPYPRNGEKVHSGMEIEFRWVAWVCTSNRVWTTCRSTGTSLSVILARQRML